MTTRVAGGGSLRWSPYRRVKKAPAGGHAKALHPINENSRVRLLLCEDVFDCLEILNDKKFDGKAFGKSANYLANDISDLDNGADLHIVVGGYGDAGYRIIDDFTRHRTAIGKAQYRIGIARHESFVASSIKTFLSLAQAILLAIFLRFSAVATIHIAK